MIRFDVCCEEQANYMKCHLSLRYMQGAWRKTVQYSGSPQPQLPDFTVSDELVFTQVGLDFAGPVYFRNMYSNKSRVFKAFIAIFTRASPRMVHLELGPDRSTETPLGCLRWFISGGELPPMISESGKTFRGSSSKAFSFLAYSISSTSLARLVRSVKRYLKKNLGKHVSFTKNFIISP